MKFTEEQYQKIVEIQEGQYSDDLYFEPRSGNKAVEHVVEKNNPELNDFIDKNYLGNQAIALMNPLTREWAHEQYVEKEKKYLWTTPLVAGIKYALIKENGKYVLSDMYLTGKGTPLTELEVVNIGLKTDWFNKEEAE